MIRPLFSLVAKTGLFVCSVAAGVGCYILTQGQGFGPSDSDARSAEPACELLPGQELAFEAEPALLARAKDPVDLDGDALGMVYILERDGDVLRTNANEPAPTAVYARLGDAATESGVGFSALALHPDFLLEGEPGYGRFYVVAAERPGTRRPDFAPEFGSSAEHHQDVVYEYTLEHPLSPSFEGARREVVRFSQPGPGHNLDSLAFDDRGRLYLAMGDGADGEVNRESPSRNASSLTSAYGKILRIDPTGRNAPNGRYGIPETNPFRMVSDALPELWAFGLRAPHSLHFDAFRGGLCIAESTRGGREEINLSFLGGEHFGWDLDQGSFFLDRSARAQLDDIVTSPVLAFDRASGHSARNIGNVVYRGERFPSLVGKLVFASHDGQLMACDPPEEADSRMAGRELRALALDELKRKRFRGLRTTSAGELVVFCEDGSVLEIRKPQAMGSGDGRSGPLFCRAAPSIAPGS